MKKIILKFTEWLNESTSNNLVFKLLCLIKKIYPQSVLVTFKFDKDTQILINLKNNHHLSNYSSIITGPQGNAAPSVSSVLIEELDDIFGFQGYYGAELQRKAIISDFIIDNVAVNIKKGEYLGVKSSIGECYMNCEFEIRDQEIKWIFNNEKIFEKYCIIEKNKNYRGLNAGIDLGMI